MRCLNPAEIQALADNEASEELRRHVDGCARCAEQVRQRDRLTASLLAAMTRGESMPPRVSRRIEAALASGHAAGATRLRPDAPSPRRRAFWSAGFLVAATVLAVLVVAPAIRGPATVSAAEVLAASASRLQAPLTGIEELEYELVIDGIPKDMMPDHADGAYRVWQAIDHDHPGRFRFASFGPNGEPISSIAEDPGQQRRVMMMTIEGQAYRFDTSVPREAPLSLLELERLHMEASITMMRASGNQLLQVVDTPEGQEYRIEVQGDSSAAASPVWDLTHARVVVQARDYRIREFEVTGTLFKQPYSVSYKLIRRTVGATLPPDAFDVPAQPGEIVLSGEGSAVPARDAMVLAFRELNKLKRQ